MIVTYQTHCTINILQHLNMMLVVVKSPFHFLKEEKKKLVHQQEARDFF